MCNLIDLTTKEAIAYIKDYFGIESNYGIAKMLRSKQLPMQPIQIAGYETGKKMTKKTASLFAATFGINVTDTHKAKSKCNRTNIKKK